MKCNVIPRDGLVVLMFRKIAVLVSPMVNFSIVAGQVQAAFITQLNRDVLF